MALRRRQSGKIVQTFLVASCSRRAALRRYLCGTGPTPRKLNNVIAYHPPLEIKPRNIMILHMGKINNYSADSTAAAPISQKKPVKLAALHLHVYDVYDA